MSKKSKVIAVGHKYIQEAEGAEKKEKKNNKTPRTVREKRKEEGTANNALPMALPCVISNSQRRERSILEAKRKKVGFYDS